MRVTLYRPSPPEVLLAIRKTPALGYVYHKDPDIGWWCEGACVPHGHKLDCLAVHLGSAQSVLKGNTFEGEERISLWRHSEIYEDVDDLRQIDEASVVRDIHGFLH